MEETNYLQDRKGLFDKFKSIPFLQSIDECFLQEMLKLSKLRKYQADEVVAKEGEYDSYLYIIITGRMRIIKHGEQIASLADQGDTFGELAIIDGGSRSATVIAEVESICLAVDVSFIDRLKPENRDAFCAIFYKLLAEILANRLRKTGEELINVKEQLSRIKMQNKVRNIY